MHYCNFILSIDIIQPISKKWHIIFSNWSQWRHCIGPLCIHLCRGALHLQYQTKLYYLTRIDMYSYVLMQTTTLLWSRSTYLLTYLLYLNDVLLWTIWHIQSNLALRNFLVPLKLFLNAKSSLSQTLNKSTI